MRLAMILPGYRCITTNVCLSIVKLFPIFEKKVTMTKSILDGRTLLQRRSLDADSPTQSHRFSIHFETLISSSPRMTYPRRARLRKKQKRRPKSQRNEKYTYLPTHPPTYITN